MFNLYADFRSKIILTEFFGALTCSEAEAQRKLFNFVADKYDINTSIVSCFNITECNISRELIMERMLNSHMRVCKRVLVFNINKAPLKYLNSIIHTSKLKDTMPSLVFTIDDALMKTKVDIEALKPIDKNGEIVDWNQAYILKRLEFLDIQKNDRQSVIQWRESFLAAARKLARPAPSLR